MSDSRTYSADITRPVKVTVQLVRDDERALIMVLPDDDQIADLERRATAIADEAERRGASGTEADVAAAAEGKALADETRVKAGLLRGKRDAALASGRATELTYTLRLPSYGRVMLLRHEATTTDPKTGQDVFNAAQYNAAVFEGVIFDAENGEAVSLDALPYQVGDYLRGRFLRLMDPDQERVLFL